MAEVKFPSNSKVTPAEGRPELKPIVAAGSAKEREKPLGKRITENLIGGDAQSVGQHILIDVLIPAAKNAVVDAVIQGVERMIYGEVRRGRVNSGGRSTGYTSYGSISKPSGRAFESDGSRPLSNRARRTHDFREVVLEERGEAERILDEMGNILDQFGSVSVGEMYTLLNITGSYTDDKYGWEDLRGSRVEAVRGGFLINLPRPIPFD